MMKGTGWLALGLGLVTAAVQAQTLDQVREQAQAVCMEDVMNLCADFIPDEEQIMGCMQARRVQLSGPCRQIFDTGMKARRKQRLQ